MRFRRTSTRSARHLELIEDGCHSVTRYQPTTDNHAPARPDGGDRERLFPHPETAPWLAEYLHEMTVFPKGKHDDQARTARAEPHYPGHCSAGKLSGAAEWAALLLKLYPATRSVIASSVALLQESPTNGARNGAAVGSSGPASLEQEVDGMKAGSRVLASASSLSLALSEILDVLGLPQDTAHRDYTRELVERCASLEQIYRPLQSRMTSRQS